MNVLLVGEFSAVHWNLKRGLIENGHNVTILASGDGFKKVPFDVRLKSQFSSRLDLAKYLLWEQPALLEDLSQRADVIQFINPFSLLTPVHGRSVYAHWLYRVLDSFRGKIALVVAGCDSFVYPTMSKALRTPCPGCRADSGQATCTMGLHEDGNRRLTETVAERADVVIPMGGAIYANSYSGLHSNVAPLQNFPVPLGETCHTNSRSGPLRVLHGINRPGFKGTAAILQCLNSLSADRPRDFQLSIPKRLPLAAYQDLLSSTNVVVDQIYSDCLAMNALQSLALGRIVMTAFDATYKSGDVDYTDCPAIDVSSGTSSILSNLLAVVMWTDDRLAHESARGVQWIRKHCDPRMVAGRFEEIWHNSSRIHRPIR